MDDALLPFVIAGMLLFAFVLFVLAMMFARRMFGWPKLEQQFPDRPDDPTVARHIFQSLYVSRPGASLPGPYIQGFVTLIACQSGLRITVWPVLSIFLKPIFLPWETITSVTVRMPVTGIKVCGLQTGTENAFTLSIIARVARKISRETNGKLALPPELQ